MWSNSGKFENRNFLITRYNLEGDLCIPPNAKAIILFLHGSGSSRHSTRNQYVAEVLSSAGFATLLIDLLTPEEKIIDSDTKHIRFNINLLASRAESVTMWLTQHPETKNLSIGYFCSSTGASAALIVASRLKNTIKAIVSRGGRPDLAEGHLGGVDAATVLIVGGDDSIVLGMNRRALKELDHAEAKELVVLQNAGHLFEEPGKMQDVARIAVKWFECYLLRTGGKFENKHSQRLSGLLSLFKEKPRIQVKFKDRVAAGEMLASVLTKYRGKQDAIVIGIPNGGVVVANEVARKLDVEFDIVVPRRLRAPSNSENAIGAIMHDGSVYLKEDMLRSLNISDEYLENEILEQMNEIERRTNLYRGQSKKYNIKDKIVILVDDGAASGASLITASRWIRKQHPGLLVIGVPVAPMDVVGLLSVEADKVEVITSPSTDKFKAVEYFYQTFSPILDQNVVQIMADNS